MKVIDFNIHISGDNSWFGKPILNGTKLVQELKKNRIDKGVLLPIKNNCSTSLVIETCQKYPNSFYGFGVISSENFIDDLKLIIDSGLSGCKFHPRFQNETIFSLDKSGALRELELNNIPIAICCWPQVKNKTINIEDVSPSVIDIMAKKYPKLIFIIMHMGGHKLWDAIFCSRSNDNVFLDCSYFIEFFRETSIEKDFWKIINKIDEKIIYGSDYPEVDISKNLKYVKKMAFKFMKRPENLFSKNILKIIEE